MYTYARIPTAAALNPAPAGPRGGAARRQALRPCRAIAARRVAGRGFTGGRAPLRVRAADQEGEPAAAEAKPAEPKLSGSTSTKKEFGGANLFDPAATASRFITRRFGLAGGLAFVALLASTEGYEIVRALLERDQDGSEELVELPSGLAYRDYKVGGGPSPRKGDFVGVNLSIQVDGETVFDSKAKGSKPVAFTFGRAIAGSLVTRGVEEGISTMRRGGVRELVVPAPLGFGDASPFRLPNGAVVPPGSTLIVTVRLEDVTGGYV